jgi:hypothetical protein
MTLLATFDHLWESKWNPIRNYQTVSLELDFSHLRAEGVRMLHSPPLKERRAQRTYSPLSDLGQEALRAQVNNARDRKRSRSADA